jgi:3'-phosphoadenosine 5'-phosphosulfate (PAPS) 3'-phosphatase
LTDTELAAAIAEEAGALLLALRGQAEGEALGKLGDTRSNELILARLHAARPGDAILSEESADDPARLEAERVWIVDPLDGTREYVLPGRPDWAVHVALWQRGRGITDAAVAQPAFVHTSARTDGRSILVSDSRPPAWAPAVAEALGARLQPMGSAGAKAMAVVRGEHDAYVHDGGQWEWDSAAPVGVALARGFHASRIDGAPLEYNRAHPYLPDLVICQADLAADVLAAIASAGAVPGA